jgi:hypothetical protein
MGDYNTLAAVASRSLSVSGATCTPVSSQVAAGASSPLGVTRTLRGSVAEIDLQVHSPSVYLYDARYMGDSMVRAWLWDDELDVAGTLSGAGLDGRTWDV